MSDLTSALSTVAGSAPLCCVLATGHYQPKVGVMTHLGVSGAQSLQLWTWGPYIITPISYMFWLTPLKHGHTLGVTSEPLKVLPSSYGNITGQHDSAKVQGCPLALIQPLVQPVREAGFYFLGQYIVLAVHQVHESYYVPVRRMASTMYQLGSLERTCTGLKGGPLWIFF